MLEAEIAAMHYIDSLLMELLEKKGVKVGAINEGIENLAKDRDAALDRVKELKSFVEQLEAHKNDLGQKYYDSAAREQAAVDVIRQIEQIFCAAHKDGAIGKSVEMRRVATMFLNSYVMSRAEPGEGT